MYWYIFLDLYLNTHDSNTTMKVDAGTLLLHNITQFDRLWINALTTLPQSSSTRVQEPFTDLDDTMLCAKPKVYDRGGAPSHGAWCLAPWTFHTP